MTSKEFVIWLKGFSEACNDLTATPKQWDRIKEELDKVSDLSSSYSYPFGTPNSNATYGTNKKQLND